VAGVLCSGTPAGTRRHLRSPIHYDAFCRSIHHDRPRRDAGPLAVRSLHSSDRACDPWRGVVLADRRSEVAELACFRLDFEEWLARRSRRDRQVIGGLGAGEPAKALVERLGLTPGRISQLRRLYQRSWKQFQGEAVATAA
jgi:hypothetical protein